MGIKDLFKQKEEKLKISDIDLKEINKYPEMHKKILFHYFMIPVSRLKGEKDKDFEKRINEIGEWIMGLSMGQSVEMSENWKKNFNLQMVPGDKNNVLFILKFSNQKVKDVKKSEKEGVYTKNIEPKADKEYMFSPYQSLIAGQVLPKIEWILSAVLKIEPHRVMHQYSPSGNKLYIKEFDGLQVLSYSLEERIKLYKKFPEIDSALFGGGLKKDIKWILDKRDDNEHMKKCCKIVDRLIKKYGLEIK